MNGIPAKSWRHLAMLFVAVSLIMAAAGWAVGVSLGLFFAGLAVCALLAPWAIDEREPIIWQALAVASVTDSIALVWLVVAIADERIALLDWLQAYLLLVSLAGFQWSIVATLRRVRLRGTLPAAAGVMVLLLWLASPIWLLHHLQTPALLPWMQRVINVQPLLAMNASVPLGVWTESPLAYHMLNLNQDVFYTLPSGPWLSILLHTSSAFALVAIGAVAAKLRR